EPSRPTVKRLFAVSRNLCAFPGCETQLVDSDTGSVLGEICHINGENPRSARYDPAQSPEGRQSFDNLTLMGGQHHKLIDDNPEKYPADRLRQIKAKHESDPNEAGKLRDAQADRMIANARNNAVTG